MSAIMLEYNDTIKINHVLTEAQREFKAELLGLASPPQSQAPQTFALAQNEDLGLPMAKYEMFAPAPLVKKTSAEVQKDRHTAQMQLEILSKQTEIMQKNQALLERLVSPPPVPASPQSPHNPKIYGNQEAGKGIVDAMAVRFMKQMDPIMSEIKALRADMDKLRSKESGFGPNKRPNPEELRRVEAEKQQLQTRAKGIKQRVHQLKQNEQATEADRHRGPATEFLTKVESKMTKIEARLKAEREAIAIEVERERQEAEARRQLERATQKIDFLGSKKEQEARLGTDFNYQEFMLSIADLAKEIVQNRTDFQTERKNYQVPVLDLKISQKELNQIATRGRPELGVLELKKKQFGDKFTQFISSTKNLGKDAAAFRKVLEKDAAIFAQGERFWTLKPDYLKQIKSTAAEAPKLIEFRRVREAKHTILIDHDFEIERLRRQMAALGEGGPGPEKRQEVMLNLETKCLGFGGTVADEHPKQVFFDVDEPETENQAQAPKIVSANKPLTTYAQTNPYERFGGYLSNGETNCFGTGTFGFSQTAENSSKEVQRTTENMQILNFKKRAPDQGIPNKNPQNSVVKNSQDFENYGQISARTHKTQKLENNNSNVDPKPEVPIVRDQGQDMYVAAGYGNQGSFGGNHNVDVPDPTILSGADVLHGLAELRGQTTIKKQAVEKPDFRNIFGLSEGSSAGDSALHDYLEVYKDELTSRDSFEVSDFSVQNNYSQVLVSHEEIQELVANTKKSALKPPFSGPKPK